MEFLGNYLDTVYLMEQNIEEPTVYLGESLILKAIFSPNISLLAMFKTTLNWIIDACTVKKKNL